MSNNIISLRPPQVQVALELLTQCRRLLQRRLDNKPPTPDERRDWKLTIEAINEHLLKF